MRLGKVIYGTEYLELGKSCFCILAARYQFSGSFDYNW